MEPYQIAAAHACSVELRVERCIVDDGGVSRDYLGPQLFVIAHQCKLVTIDELSRQIEDLAPERMLELVGLALLACDEEPPHGGADTAVARPITSYRLHVFRAHDNRERTTRIAINHYAPAPLGPHMTRFLARLRAASGLLPATAAMGWDLAATWMGPVDVGDLTHPVALTNIVQTFAQDGTVYFRAGQPPQRSELYRLDGDGMVWLRDGGELPLTCIEGHRWVLPCGAGVIETHREWQQPRRIYVRISDPARGIYVQR